MLHALRTSFMALALRRGIAMVLTLCVCVAFAEPALADSCDDDAQGATTITTVDRDGAGGEMLVNSAYSVRAGTTNVASLPRPSNANPQHALHVCHCVHAHVAPLGSRHTLTSVPDYVVSVRAMKSDTTPRSIVPEPQLRPPRALRTA